MKIIIFALFLITFSYAITPAFASDNNTEVTVEELEQYLRNGEYEIAKKRVEYYGIKQTKNLIVNGVFQQTGIVKVVKLFYLLKQYNLAIDAFKASRLISDFTIADQLYLDIIEANKFDDPVYLSKDIIDNLNLQIEDTKTKHGDLITLKNQYSNEGKLKFSDNNTDLTIDELEELLKADKYELAKTKLGYGIQHNPRIYIDGAPQILCYKNVVNLFCLLKEFSLETNSYKSSQSSKSFDSAELIFSKIAETSKMLPDKICFSNEIITKLNTQLKNAYSLHREQIILKDKFKKEAQLKAQQAQLKAFADADYERKIKEENLRQQNERAIKLENERQQLEKERLQKELDLEIIEKQKLAEEEKREQKRLNDIANKHKLLIESINTKAKQKGYKGLFKSGIVNFLNEAKNKGGLQDGRNYIFWSKISDADALLDKEFQAKQLFNNHIRYNYYLWHKGKKYDYSIIVPNDQKEMFLEGQRLLNDCFVFDGNYEYITVLGASQTVPLFKPVQDICPSSK